MDNMHKKIHIEALRIIACFFVIFNHTGLNGFFLFSQRERGSLQFWCYMFISIFCKLSVPLFFAISGSVLINRNNESFYVLWKKRIMKIVIVLITFSFLYYVEEVHRNGQTIDMRIFLFKLYDSWWNMSYWYLYAYIPFLLTLPFLRALALNLDDRFYGYMFILVVFFCGVLPIVQYFIWKGEHSLNTHVRIDWISANAVFYPLIGYFLEYRLDDIEKKGKYIWMMWILNIITIILSCYATYLKVVVTGECMESKSQSFHSSFVMINTATIFLTVKYFFAKYGDRIKTWNKRIIYSCGGCTFGIYLWHMMALHWVRDLWNILKYDYGINHMVSAFLICFITMIICYCITWITKKIPLVKKLY